MFFFSFLFWPLLFLGARQAQKPDRMLFTRAPSEVQRCFGTLAARRNSVLLIEAELDPRTNIIQ